MEKLENPGLAAAAAGRPVVRLVLTASPVRVTGRRTAAPTSARGPKICMPRRNAHVIMSASSPADSRMTASDAVRAGGSQAKMAPRPVSFKGGGGTHRPGRNVRVR